jgi:hypothetical protein
LILERLFKIQVIHIYYSTLKEKLTPCVEMDTKLITKIYNFLYLTFSITEMFFKAHGNLGCIRKTDIVP